ncbi:MAG: hypothetical protein WAO41_06190 [Candidatus Nanopelagicales bacterium]
MRNRRTTSALAASALVLTGMAGIAVAAGAQADDETPAPGTSETQAADTDPERDRDRDRVGQGARPGKGKISELGQNMLHGEIVVEDENGVAQTQLIQRGEVTAVDGGSVTVESSDGFVATYTITDETTQKRDREDGVAQVGDTAHVKALGDGSAEFIGAMSPEAEAEMEQRRTEMQEWMSTRPEGAGKPGRGPDGHRAGGPGQADEAA